MNNQQAKYELLKEHDGFRNNYTCLRFCILIFLCVASTIVVFITWSAVYRQSLNFPPKKLTDVPYWWIHRAESYSKFYNRSINNNKYKNKILSNITATTKFFYNQHNDKIIYKQIENERIYPSKLGNFIYNSDNNDKLNENNNNKFKIICYYSAPNNNSDNNNDFNHLFINKIDPNLCTHINIGIVNVKNNQLLIDKNLNNLFKNTKILKIKNLKLKILIWIGGGGINSYGFRNMIKNHTNRKLFIQSIKFTLEKYHLDGIDLDWEFPSAYYRDRQHFSQLLHEIRREYQREHRTYLLSVAVAAIEGIAYYAYDIREINNYADYVNIMTYDYHFYAKNTPFTGLNAPLYARRNEHSYLGQLNINFSVHYWQINGLDKKKIIVGLPTYGHSFRLVNPYNNGIESPAQDIGSLGKLGFVSYSEICWFQQNNIYINNVYDIETCSPYLYSGLEWISYDNEISLECKAKFIKMNEFGGAMIFSLNTDDYNSNCKIKSHTNANANANNNNVMNKNDNVNNEITFPLLRKIRSTLFNNNDKKLR